MHLAGCFPMKMFLVSYEEILNDVTCYDQKFIELKDFAIQSENEADTIYVFINQYANSIFKFCIIAIVLI